MGYYTKNGGLIGFGNIIEKRGVYDLIASQLIGDELYSFTSFTFTSAGVSGYQGPTLAQCQSAYSGAVFLTNYFSVSSGIQQWTAPATGTYEIELRGGSGGGNTTGTYYPADPGQGALIITRVTLTQGTVYNIVVGQTPTGAVSKNGSAGGGGTWIYTGSIGGSGLIAVAGGGGGWGHGTSAGNNGGNGLGGNNNANGDSRRVSSGTSINGKSGNGTGSTNGIGYGGGLSTNGSYGGGSGGAGWLSDGSDRTTGSTSTGGHSSGTPNWQGGTSIDSTALYGGFGGGGGTNGTGEAGGGGGGYTGGPAGNDWTGSTWGNGGGGGSYWTGTLVSATAGADGGTGGHLRANATNGYAKITKV